MVEKILNVLEDMLSLISDLVTQDNPSLMDETTGDKIQARINDLQDSVTGIREMAESIAGSLPD